MPQNTRRFWHAMETKTLQGINKSPTKIIHEGQIFILMKIWTAARAEREYRSDN